MGSVEQDRLEQVPIYFRVELNQHLHCLDS
jgi:hypothetical protein